uniref:Glycoside hydrolase n=1 Tax=viral metagenome TaxID=1070528 RepID=A0A6C0JTK5_9ZZZZ
MRISERGLKLLSDWEGLRNEVYLDVAKFPTIGIGHLLTKDELSSNKILIDGINVDYSFGLTNIQIERLLVKDLMKIEEKINKLITVDISQNQYDAIVIFVFNIGIGAFERSTFLKLLNNKKFDQLPNQFRRWNKSGGQIISGLIHRRENEIKLFEGLL